jgi:ribosome maturation factor RimP
VGRFAHSLCFRGRRLVDVTTDTRLERVRTVAERVAGSCGLDIFDIQLRRESSGWVLRVVIDRPQQHDADGAVVVETPEQSIGIEDCQRVSTDLSTILDVEDVLDHAYTLEVSSPGLDRPLKKEQDFIKYAGHKARLKLRVPVEGQRNFIGVLRETRAGKVEIEVDGKTVSLDLANLDKARLVPAL